MSKTLRFFATCPKGIESLLLEELRSFGVTQLKETVAGISFEAPLEQAYRACLWSRLANRVLLVLHKASCASVDHIYALVKAMPWDQHMSPDTSFAVEFSGNMPGVKHEHFAALKAKDAIADFFNERCGRRPSVDARRAQLPLYLRAARGELTVNIDLSGDSLHRRGYRLSGGMAPLKENLAAALLLRADWPGIAARGGALIDPMCGSGTILVEAALMAANIAPGLMRDYWGFEGWGGHQPQIWQRLLEQARLAREQAMQRQWPEIRGYDASLKAIQSAEENIARAGLEGRVRVARRELAKLQRPTHQPLDYGLLLTNPPYGERLGDAQALIHLYRYLGQQLKVEFRGWQAGVFTGNPDLGKQMGLRSHKQYQLFNGSIPSKLLLFDVQPQYFIEQRAEQGNESEPGSYIAPALSAGAQMFANRLKKNAKQLEKWRQAHGHDCYRLYDADMPEYAVAIDCYASWVHVAEYAPPAKVSVEAADQRLREVLAAIPQVLAVPPQRIVLKQRRRQKGRDQYQKRADSGQLIEVSEGAAKLLVNLRDYLDTGLFLDHRPVRLKIAELARGKRFLNLFCYTATATVQAAVGGARRTDSVDLSATYLDWARKNLSLNGLSETSHRLIRANVLEWLAEAGEQYDLALLDPPTFSNSKKMAGTLDVQRDHELLIDNTMRLIADDGLLIFSNNQRDFRLSPALLERYLIEDKTAWSLDKDFQRSKKIHQCWFIRHRR